MALNPNCSPDNLTIGAATICIDGSDVGLTTGGTTIRFDNTFIDVEADQIPGIARKFRESQRAFITTTLLEVSLEQIRIALGLPAANLTTATSLSLGYNAACFLPEVSMVICGPSPGCGCRTWEFDRVVSASSPEYSMTKTEAVQMEVEFEVLADCSTGNFGTVTDGCTYQAGITCN
jgi:hypothetical protein